MVAFLRSRSIFWHYGMAACWMALHGELFMKGPSRIYLRAAQHHSDQCKLVNAARSTIETLSSERGRALSVEFHSSSDQLFWAACAQRARLEALYRRVIAVTVVREPRSALLARYRMWPPFMQDKSTSPPGPRVPFSLQTYLLGGPYPRAHANLTVFARAAAGFQLNSFVPEAAMHHPPGALGGFCPAERGVTRLASLDLACELSHLGELLSHLAAAAGLRRRPDGGPPHEIRVPHRKPAVGPRVRVDAFLADAPRNASVQRALATAAECDERWYNRTDWSKCELRVRHA